MLCTLLTVTSHTLPSRGAERATHAEPRLPPAPGRFSTITAVSSTLASRVANARANTSFEPPVVCGTSSDTDRGSAACARAAGIAAASGAKASAAAARRR
jgi:hypothetical protein